MNLIRLGILLLFPCFIITPIFSKNHFKTSLSHSLPGFIEAEEYVEAEGIQLQPTKDEGGGENLAYINHGEYAEYEIEAVESGYYRIDFRVASKFSGIINVYLGGELISSRGVEATGDWQLWETVSTYTKFLEQAASLRLRIEFTGGRDYIVNLNHMRFTQLSAYPEGEILQIPGVIQAEDFYLQSGIRIENTKDIGGGSNIGYIEKGDYTAYLVNVQKEGSYFINGRISSFLGRGEIIFSHLGVEVGRIQVKRTGAWQKWETITLEVFLREGIGELRMDFVRKGNKWPKYLMNVNFLEFTMDSPDQASISLLDCPSEFLLGSTRTLRAVVNDPTNKLLNQEVVWGSVYDGIFEDGAGLFYEKVGLHVGRDLIFAEIPSTGARAFCPVRVLPLPKPAPEFVIAPATIEAESFTDQSGATVIAANEASRGKYVALNDTADYIEFKVDIPPASINFITLLISTLIDTDVKISTDKSGGIIRTFFIRSTGGGQNFERFTTNIDLEPGEQTVRIVADHPINLDNIGFSSSSCFSDGEEIIRLEFENSLDELNSRNLRHCFNLCITDPCSVLTLPLIRWSRSDIGLLDSRFDDRTLCIDPPYDEDFILTAELIATGEKVSYPVKFSEDSSTYPLFLEGLSATSVNKEPHLKVYPSPFEEELTIDISEYKEIISLSIYDIQGVMVWQDKLEPAIHAIQDKSIAQLAPGVYFLKIESSDKWESVKVQKK